MVKRDNRKWWRFLGCLHQQLTRSVGGFHLSPKEFQPPGLEIWPGALSWPGFPGPEAGTFFFFFAKVLKWNWEGAALVWGQAWRWGWGRLTGAGSVSADQLPGEFCLNVWGQWAQAVAGRQGAGMLRSLGCITVLWIGYQGTVSSHRLYLDEFARNWAKTHREDRGPIWRVGC